MISAISSFNSKGVCFSGNPEKGLQAGAKVAERVAEKARRKVPQGLTPGKNMPGRFDDDEDEIVSRLTTLTAGLSSGASLV